jgi:hypothetical protein
VAPGIAGSVVHAEVLAPPDLERVFGLRGGSIFHGEQDLAQLAFMRPSPALARYATPVRGLYLCGAGTHPGGGVMAAAGHNAAMRVLRDRRRARFVRRLRTRAAAYHIAQRPSTPCRVSWHPDAVRPMIGGMPVSDPQLDELRAVLDAALTGRATLGPQDVRRLISSWELMRRALADAPPPKLAIDSHEVPHTIWYRGDRRQALDALADGTVLAEIDAPAGATSPDEIRRDHRSRVEAARALARSWEAAHGPLPDTGTGSAGRAPAGAPGGRGSGRRR